MGSKLQVLKEGELGYGIMIEGDAGAVSTRFDEKGLMKEDFKPQPFDLSKPLIVYATLQKYGVENRNGRIYPEDILKAQVNEYNKIIARGSSIGELDHPDESTISLKGGVPHRILELYWEGNTLIGKLEILVSRAYRESGIISCDGDVFAHYLEYGVTLGISSRGVGSLKKVNGQNVVQDDFELVCWDIVSTPSTYGSYVYRNYNDYKKYDENPEAVKTISSSNSFSKGNSDFASKLQRFLNK